MIVTAYQQKDSACKQESVHINRLGENNQLCNCLHSIIIIFTSYYCFTAMPGSVNLQKDMPCVQTGISKHQQDEEF